MLVQKQKPIVCALALALAAFARAASAAEALETVELETVQVEGERLAPDGSAEDGYRTRRATAGALGAVSIAETPYSVNVTSSELMENLQAQSAAEALKYNPTVNSGSGANTVGGGAAFQIRGFVTDTNESFIDGLRMYSRTPIEDKERIEVINGATSFLYGFANPAGTVNYVLKRPTATPLARLTAGISNGEQAFVHGDFGGPLDSEGRFAYRLNVVGVSDGETVVDDQHHGRSLLSAAIDWRLTTDTLLAFDYERSRININHGDDLFTIGSAVTRIPDAPRADKNYMPSYSRTRDGYDRFGSHLDSRINNVFSLRSSFAYSDVTMYRHRGSNQIVNNAGDYTMSRNYYYTEKFTSEGNVFVDAEFATGTLQHKATFGQSFEYTDYKSAYPYATKKVSYAGTNNLYNTVSYPADKVGDTLGSPDKTTEKTRLAATVLADRVTFDEHWSLLAGATYASITDRNWDYTSYPTVKGKPIYEKDATSPSISLMYQPLANLNTYLSYVEALQKGPTAPSSGVANPNETLEPYIAKQVELGAKYRFGDLDLNTAIFHIEQANAYTDPVTTNYVEDGRETHLGIEFVATGKLTNRITVGGGFTAMRARVDKAASAALTDKRPQGVPEHLARLYAEYALPAVPGLILTGGLSYTGPIYVNALNTLQIPSVTLGDLGLRYQTKYQGKDVTLRLNVDNVENKNYWASSGSSLSLGSPRTVAVSASFTL